MRPAAVRGLGWSAAGEAPDVRRARSIVVGPVGESGRMDWPRTALAVEAGDMLALLSAGAYGMSMASTYTSRPPPTPVPRRMKSIVAGRDDEFGPPRESIGESDGWRVVTALSPQSSPSGSGTEACQSSTRSTGFKEY